MPGHGGVGEAVNGFFPRLLVDGLCEGPLLRELVGGDGLDQLMVNGQAPTLPQVGRREVRGAWVMTGTKPEQVGDHLMHKS